MLFNSLILLWIPSGISEGKTREFYAHTYKSINGAQPWNWNNRSKSLFYLILLSRKTSCKPELCPPSGPADDVLCKTHDLTMIVLLFQSSLKCDQITLTKGKLSLMSNRSDNHFELFGLFKGDHRMYLQCGAQNFPRASPKPKSEISSFG